MMILHKNRPAGYRQGGAAFKSLYYTNKTDIQGDNSFFIFIGNFPLTYGIECYQLITIMNRKSLRHQFPSFTKKSIHLKTSVSICRSFSAL